MSIRTRTILAPLALLLIAAPAISAETGIQGVSPGAPDRMARVVTTCPTFSWESVSGLDSYELVVYRLAGDFSDGDASAVDLSKATEVLSIAIPGRAGSWTPDGDNCFAAGASYAWFVRAVVGAETDEVGEWSAPRFFVIESASSPQQVREALEILTRYAQSGDGGADLGTLLAETGEPPTRANREQSTPARTPSSAEGRSVTTGIAAIRGEQPDPVGETYGVVGTSASPDGAGVGAANTAGGPDLVLDGAVPAELSEAGVDRPSVSPQTFSFSNTGGGGMMLDINGFEVVTTATDQDTVGALTCGGGQLAKWDGGAWACAPDNNTDTLTSLNCAWGEVAKWTGVAWECSIDWDSLYQLDCDEDQIPKHNGSDWVCAADEDTTYSPGPGLIIEGGQIRIDPAEFTTQITTIGSVTTASENHLALAIGADALGLIAYYDDAASHLKVVHCEDPGCNSVTISSPVGTMPGGWAPSVAIGTDGFGIISFWGGSGSNLKVAHCDDLACTSASTIGISLNAGRNSSIAIGSDGFPLISYYSGYNGFEVVHCLNFDCTLHEFGLPEYAFVGCTSLAIGGDGLGLILYLAQSGSAGTYKVAHCSNLNCSIATISEIEFFPDVSGEHCSITIGDDGFGLIAFVDPMFSQTKVVHCNNASCTNSTPTNTVSSIDLSLILGSNDRGLMAYRQGSNLRVARCIDQPCTSFTEAHVDIGTSVWGKISVAMGPDGRVLVAYVDTSILKVARLPVGY